LGGGLWGKVFFIAHQAPVMLRADPAPLDHKQQGKEPAQRQRRISHPHRQPDQLGDGLAHGLQGKPRAISEHKTAHHDHQQIDEQRAQALQGPGQDVGQHGHRNVPVGAVGRRGAQKGEHHHQQNRHRLRPLRAGA